MNCGRFERSHKPTTEASDARFSQSFCFNLHCLFLEFFCQFNHSFQTLILTMAMDASEDRAKFEDEYSPSSTVFKFDRPIPLLRGPIPASPSDDPSEGPYVLAFRDSQAWASAFVDCERKILQRCEEGARIGCAIHASSKCKAPWWKAMSGLKLSDLKEREICEVREMEECFRVAKEKCVGLAREKCLASFRDARVKVGKGGLSLKEGVELIGWASMPMNKMSSKCLIGGEFGVTNRRANELLGSDDFVKRILDERQHGTEN